MFQVCQVKILYFICGIKYIQKQLFNISFRILGRPALLELAESPNGIQGINRHRYCNALVGAIVSVTGIQKRDEMVFVKRFINVIK